MDLNELRKQIEEMENSTKVYWEFEKHFITQAINLCSIRRIEIPEELQVRMAFLLLEN